MTILSKIFHKNWLFITVIMLVATGLFFLKMNRNSLSLDEVNTILISKDFGQMLPILWNDEGNMWFYHLLMHLWLKLGDGEIWVRGLSALFGILTVPIFFKLVKEIKDERLAKLATPLFIFNLYLVFYSQTARSYNLALFLATLMSYFFFRFLKKPSSNFNLTVYAVIAVLGIYSHLLVGFVIFAQYLTLLFIPKKIPWKKIIFSAFGIWISILPLILSPAFSGHQMDWLQKPPLVHLAMGFIILGGDSVIETAIAGLVIGFYLLSKRKEFFQTSFARLKLIWLTLWMVIPIILGFIISYLWKPIYEPESFNTSLPAFVILFSIGLMQIRRTKLQKLLYLTILLFSIIRLGAWYTGSDKFQIVVQNNSPRNWFKEAQYIQENGDEEDAVIFFSYYIKGPFEYYFNRIENEHHPQVIEIASDTYAINGGTILPPPNKKLLADMQKKYKRIWLVISYYDFPQLHRKEQLLEIEEELKKDHFTFIRKDKFNQIELELFKNDSAI